MHKLFYKDLVQAKQIGENKFAVLIDPICRSISILITFVGSFRTYKKAHQTIRVRVDLI